MSIRRGCRSGMEFLFSLAQYLPVAKFLWRAIFCFLSDLVSFLLKYFVLFIQNELFVQNTQKIRKQKFHPSSASLPNEQQLVFWLRIASSSFIKPYWAVVSKSIVLLGDIKLLEVEYQILSQEIKGSRLLKQQNQTMDNIIAKVGPQCRYHRRMEPKSGNRFTDQHQARRSELQRSDGTISRQLVSSRNVVYCHKSARSVERWVRLPYYILSQSLITNCHLEGESSFPWWNVSSEFSAVEQETSSSEHRVWWLGDVHLGIHVLILGQEYLCRVCQWREKERSRGCIS